MPNTKTIKRYLRAAIIALIVVLFLLAVLFVWNYISLLRAKVISTRELEISAMLHSHGPLTASDVNVVRPWMTFDYVNRLFNVPSDYLKTKLSITDPSYPRLSISGYASYERSASSIILGQVEQALADYLTATATTPATSTTK